MNMNLPRVNNCTMRNLLRILDMNPRTSDGLAAKIRLRDKAVDNLKLAVFDVMLAQMSEPIAVKWVCPGCGTEDCGSTCPAAQEPLEER